MLVLSCNAKSGGGSLSSSSAAAFMISHPNIDEIYNDMLKIAETANKNLPTAMAGDDRVDNTNRNNRKTTAAVKQPSPKFSSSKHSGYDATLKRLSSASHTLPTVANSESTASSSSSQSSSSLFSVEKKQQQQPLMSDTDKSPIMSNQQENNKSKKKQKKQPLYRRRSIDCTGGHHQQQLNSLNDTDRNKNGESSSSSDNNDMWHSRIHEILNRPYNPSPPPPQVSSRKKVAAVNDNGVSRKDEEVVREDEDDNVSHCNKVKVVQSKVSGKVNKDEHNNLYPSLATDGKVSAEVPGDSNSPTTCQDRQRSGPKSSRTGKQSQRPFRRHSVEVICPTCPFKSALTASAAAAVARSNQDEGDAKVVHNKMPQDAQEEHDDGVSLASKSMRRFNVPFMVTTSKSDMKSSDESVVSSLTISTTISAIRLGCTSTRRSDKGKDKTQQDKLSSSNMEVSDFKKQFGTSTKKLLEEDDEMDAGAPAHWPRAINTKTGATMPPYRRRHSMEDDLNCYKKLQQLDLSNSCSTNDYDTTKNKMDDADDAKKKLRTIRHRRRSMEDQLMQLKAACELQRGIVSSPDKLQQQKEGRCSKPNTYTEKTSSAAARNSKVRRPRRITPIGRHDEDDEQATHSDTTSASPSTKSRATWKARRRSSDGDIPLSTSKWSIAMDRYEEELKLDSADARPRNGVELHNKSSITPLTQECTEYSESSTSCSSLRSQVYEDKISPPQAYYYVHTPSPHSSHSGLDASISSLEASLRNGSSTSMKQQRYFPTLSKREGFDPRLHCISSLLDDSISSLEASSRSALDDITLKSFRKSVAMKKEERMKLSSSGDSNVADKGNDGTSNGKKKRFQRLRRRASCCGIMQTKKVDKSPTTPRSESQQSMMKKLNDDGRSKSKAAPRKERRRRRASDCGITYDRPTLREL